MPRDEAKPTLRMPPIQRAPIGDDPTRVDSNGLDEKVQGLPDAALLFTRPAGRPLEVWHDPVAALPSSKSTAATSWAKKRPRSPGVNTQRPRSPGVNTQLQPLRSDGKSPRRMRSFVQNFLADDMGTFRSDIDLHKHAVDTGRAITDADVQEVARMLPGLQTLRLSHCIDVSDACLWAIAKHCPSLTGIYMSQCERITDLGLRVLAHNCKLVTVDLSDCKQLSDLALATLAAGCWMIETFILARCPHVTDIGIAKIAQCCKGLTYIDVSECHHVGEFGDKALLELGKWCGNLKHLDLFGCRHVRDMGIRAIANGCPRLSTLKLTGCRDVSSVSIQELASKCHALMRLSLAGCVKTRNEDLVLLATSCKELVWLDISGSPNLSNRGIAALAQHCTSLTHLNVSDCQHVNDKVLRTLGDHLRSLTSLSLVNCTRITEAGIDAITTQCTKLFTLNMTDCPHIRRRYLHELVARLEFVDWSSAFFGIEPLPNAMDLQLRKERRILERQSAIHIQAVMRGCLARGGVYGAKLRRVERTTLPTIQARIRGWLARSAYRQMLLARLQLEMATIIQRAYRQCLVRRMCRRARRLLRIRNSQEAAAVIFQKMYRGHKGRRRVAQMRARKAAHAQLQARRAALLELAAIKVQQMYRGHKGRGDCLLLREMREAARLQREKERVAAAMLQRVYRGHRGRKAYQLRLLQLQELQNQHAKATKMQASYRRFQTRQHAKVVAAEEAEAAKLRAVVCIQKHWRGTRDKHLGAILLGLVHLRRREHEAARVIQTRCRAFLTRGLLRAMKEVLRLKLSRERGATTIQRVFRGHKGREAREVQIELRKLEGQAKPLYVRITKFEKAVAGLKTSVETLQSTLATNQADEVAIASELEKTMTIKSKFHDSARITGAKQRYLTRYLQAQLADQLQKKRMLVAVESRNLELAVAELNESEKQLRFAKRELQPLTEGVERKTKASRVTALSGYRVRAAVAEGSNRWIELYDPVLDRLYYVNAWSQETRRVRPLAMHIFGDTFVPPYKGTSWYQCRDETTNAFYYYNRETREYRWEPPEATTSSRDVFEAQSKGDLTQRAVRTRRIGAWEEHLDPVTNTTYYYDPATGESTWTLPPTVAHSGRLSTGRRSVHSIERDDVPLPWQYYYGYDVDDSQRLVKRASPRSPWTECYDESYQLAYYYNQLTTECRWTKPDDFDVPVTKASPSPGLEWYNEQSEKNALSARRFTKTRAIGTVWEEHADAETGVVYYFNTITGETRWSLSPRSSRDDEAAANRMPLTLKAKLDAADERGPLTYAGRDMHAAWLAEAIEAKEWAKADGLVEEIRWREMQAAANPAPPDDVDTTPEWQQMEENGAVFWYNTRTGESTWDPPTGNDGL
ncbi:hypothetical protein SPRG_06300 [Saprolegnia parasitica CBS 223.65]|uniref:WW domain-containing protein n=1 Tax=Saprolegnia parasitica (strain CBS 223.65) TaxID=695850 RepID=A0A067CGH2_SAPPC|nr:hypothetical protein SPRG_06300 [Saprolegnia parasitica CBS 223.65]KDO28250.1 hypothetical protein SPRG_06300 [Saprolegnia parasitica CBS 223.65]|eukprot:XP_012201072.1 hypothetical protein SPRG_06300 [Saprolegnia parasitica CBS 223.65]